MDEKNGVTYESLKVFRFWPEIGEDSFGSPLGRPQILMSPKTIPLVLLWLADLLQFRLTNERSTHFWWLEWNHLQNRNHL
jgi:hypothetical protein